MIINWSIDFLNAAVRNVRRLRFSVEKNRIIIVTLLSLSLFFLCSCSSRAEEPVLETIRTQESADDPVSGERKDGIISGDNSNRSSSGDGSDRALSGHSGDGASPENSKGSTWSRNDTGDQTASGGALSAPGQEEYDSRQLLTVHVCGAVKKEGVYTLPPGSRIRDAVDAAGGFSEDADRSYLNLAMELEDAWQIRVPAKKETEALETPQSAAEQESSMNAGGGYGVLTGQDSPFIVKGGAAGDGTGTGGSLQEGSDTENEKINLNTATAQELMKIPGVGEKKAQSIIDYREKNGRFEAIEDLMKVPGIKDASFRKMKDYITV